MALSIVAPRIVEDRAVVIALPVLDPPDRGR
jgi:hypothetical protein